MVKRKTLGRLKLSALVSAVLGFLVTYGSHITILVRGLPQGEVGGHAVVNLVASVLLTYGFVVLLVLLMVQEVMRGRK